MKIKRYMCFAIDWYYPCGWFDDMEFSTDDLEEAKAWSHEVHGCQSREVWELDDSAEKWCKKVYECVSSR